MINQTKIIADRLQVTERHARRLISEGDSRAVAIIAELPKTDAEEFYWRGREMLYAVAELHHATDAFVRRYAEWLQFCLEAEGRELPIPEAAMPAVKRIYENVEPLRQRVPKIIRAAIELNQLVQFIPDADTEQPDARQ